MFSTLLLASLIKSEYVLSLSQFQKSLSNTFKSFLSQRSLRQGVCCRILTGAPTTVFHAVPVGPFAIALSAAQLIPILWTMGAHVLTRFYGASCINQSINQSIYQSVACEYMCMFVVFFLLLFYV
jgi:hypothetical protein